MNQCLYGWVLQEELVEGDEAVVNVAVVGEVKLCVWSRRGEWILCQECSLRVMATLCCTVLGVVDLLKGGGACLEDAIAERAFHRGICFYCVFFFGFDLLRTILGCRGIAGALGVLATINGVVACCATNGGHAATRKKRQIKQLIAQLDPLP